MITRRITIGLPAGLEARPVAMLVQVASQYDSSIYIEDESRKVNAKSIMGIMAFNPSNGMKVNIVANGEDEAEALDAMEKFLVCE